MNNSINPHKHGCVETYKCSKTVFNVISKSRRIVFYTYCRGHFSWLTCDKIIDNKCKSL